MSVKSCSRGFFSLLVQLWVPNSWLHHRCARNACLPGELAAPAQQPQAQCQRIERAGAFPQGRCVSPGRWPERQALGSVMPPLAAEHGGVTMFPRSE